MNFFNKIAVIILLTVILAGCQKQAEREEVKTVKVGSVVLVDYAGGFLNGTLFDTSIREAAERAGILNPNRFYQPVEVKVGEGKILRGIEEALLGMKEKEAKTVNIPPEKAYGPYREDAIRQIPLRFLENQTENLSEGDVIFIETLEGDVPVVIKKIGKENATVDFNHPLAGETVTFAVIVRDIQ